MKKQKQAIVVGSGFGGLAIALRLQASGVNTTILEKAGLPGGKAQVFKDDGFTFDAGPTVITAPHCLEEIFELAGKKLSDYIELLPVQPFYRLFWEDKTTFDYTNDEEVLNAEINRLSPEDLVGYRKFCQYAEEVFKAGYEELCHVPFLHFSDMIKAAPQLVRLEAYRSVYSKVASYIKSDKLRQAFSFNSLLIGGHPFRASSIYTLIHPLEKKWGVSFPRGGTHALVKAMQKLFEEQGGKLLCNAAVDEIIVSKGRTTGVRLANGEVIDSDFVVSNADVYHTYSNLLRRSSSARRVASSLAGKRYSMSLFLIYFGVRGDYPGLAHHNVMFGSRYKGLLDDIFDRGIVSDDFSIYLHAPSLSDQSMAPPGHSAYYALVPVPNLLNSKVDWNSFRETFADRVLSYLEARYLPGLKERIVTKRLYTPLDFAEEQNAHLGSAFSLEPTLTQSAWFRIHNRDRDIKGLYFVGAGTHPGAGIPGVVGSAKATFKVISDLELNVAAVARRSYSTSRSSGADAQL